MKLHFKCPKCSGNVLEEVVSDIIAYNTVTKIDTKDGLEYAENPTLTNGKLSSYICARCGHVFAKTEKDLFAKLTGELV